MRVYVAGASAEIDRAETVIAELLCHPGIELTEDWPAKIRAATHRDGVDPEQDRAAVAGCMAGVLACDLFLLLAPAAGVHSTGLWWELGIASVHRVHRFPAICWSGPRRGILWTLADWYATSDTDAIRVVVEALRVRAHYEAQQ